MSINQAIYDEIKKNNNMITTSQVRSLGYSKQILTNYVKEGYFLCFFNFTNDLLIFLESQICIFNSCDNVDNMAHMPYNDIRKHEGKDRDKFTIEFYEKENGDIPVEEFLLGLNIKILAKQVGIIKILQEKRNLLREPYSKYLGYLESVIFLLL